MENKITSADIGTESKLFITLAGKGYLKITAQWANILSILGFIGIGILTLVALFLLVLSPFLGKSTSFSSVFGFPFILIGILYLLMAILYFFPTYYLYSFANTIKSALNTDNQDELDESLLNLKKTFKFIGITTIVIISLYVIAIPIMFIFTASRGFIQ